MSDLKHRIDKGITEFYLDVDIDIIKESLSEDGFDIANLDNQISKFSKKLKFNYQALATKNKIDNLLEIIVAKFQTAIEKNIEKPISTLKGMIEEKELSVQFRNLEKLNEDEIKEIIKGKNLVDLLDELDDEVD
jgi:hypothetical protein